MQAPPIPADEPHRVAALHALDLLDTAPEIRFDRLTRLAKHLFKVPIALVSLVDTDRQWFKSKQGLDACQTGRDISFCGHAILGDAIFEVTDASRDERFADNPLVTGPPSIRFYAGAPLSSPRGYRVGTLCIIDSKPRHLSAEQRTSLRDLAKLVEQEFENALLRLKEREEQYRSLVNNIPGITYRCLYDEHWTMLYMSNQVDPLSGYPATDFIDNAVRSYASVIHPDDTDLVTRQVTEALQSGHDEWQIEYRILHRNGSIRWTHERGTAKRNEQGQVMFLDGFILDITERKKMERVKNEFVSVVSHELRTPLTAISGALGLLTSASADQLPPQGRQLLEIASRNSQRLAALINDLLDIEKLSSGKMQFNTTCCTLRPIIELAIDNHLTYGAERQIQLVLADRAGDAEVEVDPERLMQVLANLLSNAIKFSPQGNQVEINIRADQRWVRVGITDHGAGIPTAYREHIFERFSQADSSDSRQKGGTGLGLAISRELIERMAGRIGFESQEGAGATFWFELPVCQQIKDR